MKIFFNLSFILSVLFAQVAYSLVLLDLELPDLVKIENNDIDGDGDIDDDDVEPIKLDCKYELDEDPSYLVVKWFINDINIYQWIRGKQPSVFPHFRHHIGDIEPTSSDKNHEYRGFNLINPSIALSGTYKCLVQTDRGSKAIEKELHVVDISNSTYEFLRRPVENETYLECRVTNIFPQPRIDLVSVDDNLFLSGQDTQIKVLDNDYYEASVTAIAQNTDDDDFDDFSCLVTFDGLNLNVTDIMSELNIAYTLVLRDLEVPDLVKIENNDIDGDGDVDDDDVEPIKLDCKYELDEDPSYLVVKWFMNDISIYQWIRGKQPSVFPHFRDHIGDIEPTSSDRNHEYRGLTLINPSIELSGTYKCLVQTDRGSKAMEKDLHVVDISNSTIVFENHPGQNETHLECRVTIIFPKPRIHLVSSDETIILSGNDTQIKVLDNDYFDASMTAIAQNTDDDIDDFFCFITFDGLNLNLTAKTVRSGVSRTFANYQHLGLMLIFMGLITKLLSLL